jgi:hypothetical protein
VQPLGQRLSLDDEIHLEAGQQDFVEHPDGQLGLANGETPHRAGAPEDTLRIGKTL